MIAHVIESYEFKWHGVCFYESTKEYVEVHDQNRHHYFI